MGLDRSVYPRAPGGYSTLTTDMVCTKGTSLWSICTIFRQSSDRDSQANDADEVDQSRINTVDIVHALGSSVMR
jgi:hypothetical protein